MEYYSFKSGINAKINYSNHIVYNKKNHSVYKKFLQFAIYLEVRYQNFLVDVESLQYNCRLQIQDSDNTFRYFGQCKQKTCVTSHQLVCQLAVPVQLSTLIIKFPGPSSPLMQFVARWNCTLPPKLGLDYNSSSSVSDCLNKVNSIIGPADFVSKNSDQVASFDLKFC